MKIVTTHAFIFVSLLSSISYHHVNAIPLALNAGVPTTGDLLSKFQNAQSAETPLRVKTPTSIPHASGNSPNSVMPGPSSSHTLPPNISPSAPNPSLSAKTPNTQTQSTGYKEGQTCQAPRFKSDVSNCESGLICTNPNFMDGSSSSAGTYTGICVRRISEEFAACGIKPGDDGTPNPPICAKGLECRFQGVVSSSAADGNAGLGVCMRRMLKEGEVCNGGGGRGRYPGVCEPGLTCRIKDRRRVKAVNVMIRVCSK
jgi:hypothetical protein